MRGVAAIGRVDLARALVRPRGLPRAHFFCTSFSAPRFLHLVFCTSPSKDQLMIL
jgi:hypothetical protein